ncbi:MAG: protein kinase [Lysobacterales bacterium]
MIEIPGYRLLRQLGRGGMATVYLAIQESVDREVALKVMSSALLADPTYGERFLREARIAAKLRHPHVVGIHDVGREGDHFFIAMEYVSGGQALSADGHARDVALALRVVREVASALHYAHSKGFVHRDVKPDNILLREDGTAVLTDFGIARANDSATRMTRTGAVVGTPHYMSPEQARGKALDGRSDLYSLGIVLYELLVGRVPYHAEDSLAVGIMHITQPVPQLPPDLAPLQSLLDRLLAKQPEDRFQDGAAVVAAVTALERRIGTGEFPQWRGAGAVAEPAPRRAEPRQRAEPSLGRLDDIAAAVGRERLRSEGPARARRGGGGLGRWVFAVAALFVLAVGGVLAWRHQDRLRALLPRTELNDLLARADQAAQAGRLSGAPDSARALYEAARAIDADNDLARSGLRRVGEALLAQAREATGRNDFAGAHARLADARAVLGGGPAVDQAEADLKRQEAAGTQLEDLLRRADEALAAGRLLEADGAVAQYQRVLALDSGNSLAQAGLKRVGAALAAQARELLVQGKLDEATARLEDFARMLPSDPAIPNLRAELAKARESAGAALEAQLKRAQELLRAGRIAGGGEDNALALFQAVLARDPANARARAGLGQVAQALVVQANAALDEDNAAAAERLLNQATLLAPNGAELAAARARLRELREQAAIAAQRPVLSPQQLQRVAALVGEAEKAAAAGRLMLPPGDSAYDKYRAALAIDADNAQALAGLQALPQRARELYAQALAVREPDRARDMTDTLAQLSPGEAALPGMRARVADAYLDLAEQRIGENRPDDARRALTLARQISPANPRLAPVEQKLRELAQ